MKLSITKFPPSWCNDAIAGPRGWYHPKTNELLISVKGIEVAHGTNPYEDAELVTTEAPMLDETIANEPLIDEVVAPTVVIDEAEPVVVVIDETPEQAPEVIKEDEAPVEAPKRRGRPPKNA